jgi:hypothetical protein
MINEGIDPFYNRALGTISAERGHLSPLENIARTKSLHNDLKATGHKVVPVKGGYIENHGTPDAKEVHERSFLVMHKNTGNDNGAIKKTLTTLGKKYDQDSILHKPHNSDIASLHGTNKASFPGYGKSVAVGKKQNYSGGEFFTEMPNGKRFTFGENTDYFVPQVRESKNLRDVVPIQEISDNARAAMHRIMKDPNAHPTMKAAASKALGGKLAHDWSGSKPADNSLFDSDGEVKVQHMENHEGILRHHGFKPDEKGIHFNADRTQAVRMWMRDGKVNSWEHHYHDAGGNRKKDVGLMADTLHDSLNGKHN